MNFTDWLKIGVDESHFKTLMELPEYRKTLTEGLIPILKPQIDAALEEAFRLGQEDKEPAR